MQSTNLKSSALPIIATLIISLSGCASKINIDPSERSVDCSNYTASEGSTHDRSIVVKREHDDTWLRVLAFGSAEQRYEPTFQYGKDCTINVLRDVKSIVGVSRSRNVVMLRNGEQITIGSYQDPNGKQLSPYNKDRFEIIALSPRGGVETYTVLPFGNLYGLKVLDKPLQGIDKRALELWTEEQLKDSAIKARERLEREERIAQSKAEDNARKEAQARLARDIAMEKFANPGNIGKPICMAGQLEYTVPRINVFGQQVNVEKSEAGMIVGYFEGISDDMSRVKIRIKGWSTDAGRLHFSDANSWPKMRGISSKPGSIEYHDTRYWGFCTIN